MRKFLLLLPLLVFSISCKEVGLDEALQLFDNYEERIELLRTLPESYIAETNTPGSKELVAILKEFGEKKGYTINIEPLEAGLMGATNKIDKIIFINARLAEDAQLGTMLHELAHTCHAIGLTKTEQELFAEVVAFMVAPEGITSKESIVYILRVAASRQRRIILERNREAIEECVAEIRSVVEDAKEIVEAARRAADQR